MRNFDPIGILIVFGVVVVSMVLHEMSHAIVAYWLGDETAKREGRLTLNPLKHIDPWMSILMPLLLYLSSGVVFGGAKPVPINTRNLKGGAWGMALVGIAGPLMNFILAFGTFLIAYYTGAIYDTGVLGLFVWQMIMANLGFCVFNMLPVPPLDGSRVLYAIAPDFVRNFMEKMERGAGIMVVLILVLFFGTALSSFTSGVIASIFNFFLSVVGAGTI